ncbi:hypothetical protein BD408DRAFT_419188 [Parasitella parasitica]|nr:hypothetical protein BD408DRAFT_419188 [Parasitella parasitica]
MIISFYLGRSRDLRIHRLLYVLSQVVERDFRQDTLQFYFGFKKVRLSPFDIARKQ